MESLLHMETGAVQPQLGHACLKDKHFRLSSIQGRSRCDVIPSRQTWAVNHGEDGPEYQLFLPIQRTAHAACFERAVRVSLCIKSIRFAQNLVVRTSLETFLILDNMRSLQFVALLGLCKLAVAQYQIYDVVRGISLT